MAPLPSLTGAPTNRIHNKWLTSIRQRKPSTFQSTAFRSRWVDLDIQVTFVDDRRDYGEIRYRAYGLIDGVSYCLVFTDRNEKVRPISLRRAHAKEMRRHVP